MKLRFLTAFTVLFVFACANEGSDLLEGTRAAKMMGPPAAEAAPPILETEATPRVEPMEAPRPPDVVFVPTPEAVVEAMLSMAAVGKNDIVYDLGCGDGRIAIAAVRDFGAKKAVCVDIDPQRVREARANVKRAGLEKRVEIRQGDLFQTDLSEPTVVTLYLLRSLNLKLRPKLQEELRVGSRIVSQSFDMGDWEPEEKAEVEDHSVYLWRIAKKERKDQKR
jgi:SAM-dependent methyltransferase